MMSRLGWATGAEIYASRRNAAPRTDEPPMRGAAISGPRTVPGQLATMLFDTCKPELRP